jgi:hypothetical protein
VSHKRGQRGKGNGANPTVSYVAKHDHPTVGVSAGQVFHSIEDVPANIAVVPVPVK